MKKLGLLGASGHGKVVADAAEAAGWQEIVFFDDSWPERTRNGKWNVIGDTDALLSRFAEFDGVLVAIGNCSVRAAKHRLLREAGASLATIVHPKAVVSHYAILGAGTVVMAGAVLNVDARVGEAAILNTGSTIDHDCLLGEAVHISPGANLSGNVTVGPRTWVGVGAAVRQGTVIGADVMVGAGAVVVKPISDGATVIGNPALPIQPI